MGIKSSIKKFGWTSRSRIPVEELEPCTCENCGHEFQGHFCPNCGQEVAEFNRPFGFIIYDFVGNFFAFDTRFFRTFKYLLIRPGFLTSEFFYGRRMRYSPPFRIFVFLSFVLFLFLQILTERSLDAGQETNDAKVTGDVAVQLNRDLVLNYNPRDSIKSSETAGGDSLRRSQSLVIQGKDSTFTFDIGDVFFTKGKLRDKLAKLAEMFEQRLQTTTDPVDRQKLQSYVAICRSPEIVISNLMKYLSWAFFVLLPLFALVLKLFYIRRKQNYIRHLIFSIHLHSFLFFVLIIIAGLRLIFSSGLSTIIAVLLLSFPVYFIIALHHFYRQHYLKAFLKFIGISLIYNTVASSVVLFVFLKSLQII